MKIRGKKPSVSQGNRLKENGIDWTQYLIVGIKMVKPDDDKKSRLAKYDNKVEEWTLVDRETNEIKKVYMD